MLGVHAFVAEDTADLIYALNTAHDKALEVKLGRNTQVHVYIKGVVVRDEGTRGSAAGDGVENRRLDLHVAAVIEEAADIAHEL